MKKTILGAIILLSSIGANANVFWKCDQLFQEFQQGETDKLFIDVKEELFKAISTADFRVGGKEMLERQVLNLEDAYIEYKNGDITKEVMNGMLFNSQIMADQYTGTDCTEKEGASIF